MRKAFVQLHIAVFLAGFTGVLGRLISLNEGWLVWYRLLLSSLSLWLLLLFGDEKSVLKSKDIWRLFGVGAIASLHWVSFYGSIKASNVSIALVCFSSIGFFTSLLEPLIFRQRPRIPEVLLGLLVVGGVFLIFQFDPNYKAGIAIGMVSAFLGSIFPILNRKLLQRIPPRVATRYELTGGFLFLTVLIPLFPHYFPSTHCLPTAMDWIWLLVLSLLCTVLAFNLSMSALRKISAFTVNLTYNLEPVYGIALAFLLYREDKYLGWGFYSGFALILLAILVQTVKIIQDHKLQKK
jgi:drug/metabolite transporter (DMT)-like permease